MKKQIIVLTTDKMKKRMINKKLLLSFLAIFSITVVYGQQQIDSLMFYLELSLKNNPTVLQRLDEYQAALQKVPQVGSLSDPELNVGVFLSPMEQLNGNQVANIQLMQMFPWFGVLKNAKDEMSLMAKAKYESFRDARTQLLYDVQRTWYELQKVQQNIRLSGKNIELLKTIESISKVKFKTGPISGTYSSSSGGNGSAPANASAGTSSMQSMGARVPVNMGTTPVNASSSMQGRTMGTPSAGSGLVGLYRIQIEVGDLENKIFLLKNQQSTLVARFNSFLNRSVISPVSVFDELKPDSLDITLSALSDTMLVKNPMLSMLKYEQQSLDARSKMTNRMGYPMVGVGLDYSLINKNRMSTSSMNGKDMMMPMVKVTLPIYRRKYKAMQAETKLLKSATENSYEASSNNLQSEYYEAMQLYQDAGRRMVLYESQGALAKQSLDIMIKSFSASGAGLTDVLQVCQQRLDYEYKIVEAVADYNTAIAWLKKLMANSKIQ